MKIKTFRYGYKATIFNLAIIITAFLLSLIVMLVYLFVLPAFIVGFWAFFAATLYFALLGLCFFLDGAYYPIYIDDNEVEYRGKKYPWSDIKITVCPSFGPAAGYFLLINTFYFEERKDIIRQLIKGPCFFLKNTRVLDMILPFYKSKVLVVDRDGQEMDLAGSNKLTNKLNNVIYQHNSNIKG